MQTVQLSFVRKFLLWYLRTPHSPYVNYNFSIDFSRALAYLEELNQATSHNNPHQPRVTPQHLLTAAIGRVYAEFPLANASVIGDRIIRHPHVGVAMPVDLIARDKVHGEFGAVVVERAEQQSLRQIAHMTSHRVCQERGESSRPHLLKKLMPLARHVPQPILRQLFNTVDLAMQVPFLFKQIHQRFPATVLVSNIGSAVKLPKGVLARGSSFTPPERLLGMATFMVVFPLQEEVIAVDGRSEIRKVLPIDYIFDHRIFDGVMCGKILSRIVEILSQPSDNFGRDGEQRGKRYFADRPRSS